MAEDLKYNTTWEWQVSADTVADSCPEHVSQVVFAAIRGIVNLVGDLKIYRVDAEDGLDCFYRLRYPDHIAVRQDGCWNGPTSVCFFGPGGNAKNLTDMIKQEIEWFGYYAGCVICKPPRGVYGPVIAPAYVDQYGQAHAAKNRADDLAVAMQHALGRIPSTWPEQTELEPVA